MAGKIAAGDWFLHNNETTLFYPYSGTLHYEALTWPTVLVAALLFKVTAWSATTIYHLVLLCFWALSAPAMLLFLRRLGLSKSAALAGGIIFSILPYRMSYANEYQMQLAFLIPLFYLLLRPFIDHPTPLRGAALGLYWWFFAVTELYQAIFILFTLPFILLALLSATPRLLTKPRFWLSSLTGAATTLLLMPLMLWPYLQQKSAGAVERPLREIVRHSIQPLSYLMPFGRLRFWQLDAKIEELQGYPTLTVIILALTALFFWLREVAKEPPPERRRQYVTIMPLLISLVLFAALTFYLHFCPAPAHRYLLRCWRILPLCSVAATILFSLTPTKSSARRFLTGLAAAAVFTFFLSLGPTMDLHLSPLHTVPNLVYMTLYKIVPLLSGFRAACRFGIFVLFFLTVAAACGLDRLLTLQRGKYPVSLQRLISSLAVALIVLAVAAESWPTQRFLSFKRVDHIGQRPLAQRLAARHEPYVLAAIPMGNRVWDGTTMYGLLKDRHLSIYGWAGFFPKFSFLVKRRLDYGEIPQVASMLHQVWPEVLLWIDRSHTVMAHPSFVAATPEYYTKKRDGGYVVDYPGMFSTHATEIDRDDRFTLMALQAPPAATNIQKIFRSDFVRRLPLAQATLLATTDTTVTVTFNHDRLPSVELKGGQPCTWFGNLHNLKLADPDFNTLVFQAAEPLLVSDFKLVTEVTALKRSLSYDGK